MIEPHDMGMFDPSLFRSPEVKRYSVWVYDGGEIIRAYGEETPNAVELWFKFNGFSHFYWELMESECVRKNSMGTPYYSFKDMKDFMVRNLMCGTNIPGIDFSRRNADGSLVREEYDKVMRIHPRILRVLFDKVDIFGKELTAAEEKALEKQCAILFGDSGSVSNPHPWVTTYCNLVAFWDKFGLNYFDVMRLPNEVFKSLKKVAHLDNSYRSKSLSSKKK